MARPRNVNGSWLGLVLTLGLALVSARPSAAGTYEDLGLHRTPMRSEIRQAYRGLAEELDRLDREHPDAFPGERRASRAMLRYVLPDSEGKVVSPGLLIFSRWMLSTWLSDDPRAFELRRSVVELITRSPLGSTRFGRLLRSSATHGRVSLDETLRYGRGVLFLLILRCLLDLWLLFLLLCLPLRAYIPEGLAQAHRRGLDALTNPLVALVLLAFLFGFSSPWSSFPGLGFPMLVVLLVARAFVREAPRDDSSPEDPASAPPPKPFPDGVEGELARVLSCYPPGRFEDPQVIGRGGMSMVFKAHDTLLRRPVAFKVVDSFLIRQEQLRDELLKRFRREAHSLAALDHPCLPAIHDVSEGETPFLMMEYIEGRDLQKILDEEGPQDPELVRRWLIDLAEALSHTHAKGIIHRDLKPGNVLLDPSGKVRIIDFGIALVGDSTRISTAGSTLGTIRFSPPEQLAGGEVDARSDVYSLAVTGYFLVSGQFPYTTVQLAVSEGFEPEPLGPEVPPVLAVILARGVAMEPESRFPDMDTFRAALVSAAP